MRDSETFSQTGSGQTPAIDWSGDGSLFVLGNFAGDIASLELSPDAGATWIPARNDNGDNVTLTDEGVINFSVGNCQIRGAISSGGGSPITFIFRPR